MPPEYQTISAVVVGLFTGMGAVLLFVDKQRRAWVTEARHELQAEIDELRKQLRDDKVLSDARILALEGLVAGLKEGNREGRAMIGDVMVAIAKGASGDEAIEGLRKVVGLLH